MNANIAQTATNRVNTHRRSPARAENNIRMPNPEENKSRAEIFLDSLPTPALTDLPDDNQDCPLCIEPYRTAQRSERPVRLPCDHIIGKDCLLKWLQSSLQNVNNNTCPMCRAVLFEHEVIAPVHPLGVGHELAVSDSHRRRVRADLARLREAVDRAPRNQDERDRALEVFFTSNTAMLDALDGSRADAEEAARLTASNQVRDRALEWINRRDVDLRGIVLGGRQRAEAMVNRVRRAEEHAIWVEEINERMAASRDSFGGGGAWTPTVAPPLPGFQERDRVPESLGGGVGAASEAAAGGTARADEIVDHVRRDGQMFGMLRRENAEMGDARHRALVDGALNGDTGDEETDGEPESLDQLIARYRSGRRTTGAEVYVNQIRRELEPERRFVMLSPQEIRDREAAARMGAQADGAANRVQTDQGQERRYALPNRGHRQTRGVPGLGRTQFNEPANQDPGDGELLRALGLLVVRNHELGDLLTRAEARPGRSVAVIRAIARVREALTGTEHAERELTGSLAGTAGNGTRR